MTDESFYVILPSNVDTLGTPSKYRTRLENPIALSNYADWEVGLVEISFYDAIETFTGEETISLIINKDDLYEENIGPFQIEKLSEHVDTGYYIHSEGAIIMGKDGASVSRSINYAATKFDIFQKQMESASDFNKYMRLQTVNNVILLHIHLIIKDDNDKRIKKLKLSAALAWALGYHPIPTGLTPKVINENLDVYLANGTLKDQEFEIEYKANVDLKRESKFIVHPNRVSYSLLENAYWWSAVVTTNTVKKQLPIAQLTIPKEHHSDIGTVLEVLIYLLNGSDEFKKRSVSFEKQSLHAKLILKGTGLTDNSDGVLVQMESKLATILGFTQCSLILPKGRIAHLNAKLPPDYRRSIHNIYIYCSLCENTDVGDKRVPLLRNVAFNIEKFGRTINVLFDSPLYVNVNTKLIESIDVELRDDMGVLVPFIEGKTVLTLHFRRK